MPTGHYERKRTAPMVDVICHQCGKQFTVYKCVYKENSTKYCSRQCKIDSSKNEDTLMNVLCTNCGKLFSKRKHKICENNYCSLECKIERSKGRNFIECDFCHTFFHKKPSSVKNRNYCSNVCRLSAIHVDLPKWENYEYIRDYNNKYSRSWYMKNRKRILENAKIRHKKDPTKRTSYMIRRRARENELPDNFTSNDWEFCLKWWNYSCAVCGRPSGESHIIAADHWIPISKSDSPGTVVWNIIPLCHGRKGCNNSKGGKDPIEWLIKKIGEGNANILINRINEYFSLVLLAQ